MSASTEKVPFQIPLSTRLQALKPSSTLAVTARLKALTAAGVDVVGFGAGEPDFDTPAHIVEAACNALREGKTRYEPVAGTPEARDAVAEYLGLRTGLTLARDNIMISVGGKHSLFLAFMAVLDPGDEVLLPAPYWVSYPEQAKLAGATVREIPAGVDNDFKITPQQLREALSERSRVLVMCSPSNPTGTTYTPGELGALAQVVEEHPQLVVFSDEIYDRLVYGDTRFASFSSIRPAMQDRTVVFNGLSKAYAMTGWRVGFTAAPARLIQAMSSLQGQMTSNIASFILAAIPAALQGPQECVEVMRSEFARRAEHIHRRLAAIPGIRCPKPTGAFYVFPDISGAVFGKRDPDGKVLKTADEFAASLLEHGRVAVVSGVDFSAPNHVRLSFATSLEQIEEGLNRFESYLAELK
ncbi:MAG: pyridoxal phosphate-dependent aminotransferase [Armatimonadetes bacterium]|nr:pyridoxal phosphate-dependent aminotransferase [Armatimonadota bacterium]